MGCFLGCFGISKDKKRRKQRNKQIPRDQRHGNYVPLKAAIPSVLYVAEKPITSTSELRHKPEEQPRLSARKRVTFDSTVTTYERVSVHVSSESLYENDGEKEKEREENLAKPSHRLSPSCPEQDLITSSVGSYPKNYRYQNCRYSDEEDEDSENGDYTSNDDDDEEEEEEECGDYGVRGNHKIVRNKVWSESVHNEEEETPVRTRGLPEKDTKTVVGWNQNARDRSGYVHPVLNPVENLSQWKAVKSKGTPRMKAQKENFNSNNEALAFSPTSTEQSVKQMQSSVNLNCNGSKNRHQEVAIDASLSTWLVSDGSSATNNRTSCFTGFDTVTPEKSVSKGSNSINSYDDRPILGAWTVEELKQLSLSTPRKSSTRSPDEMPIVGTVGTYWHCTPVEDCNSASSFNGIPNTTSKYREDKTVNWYSTPFETRLERALNRGAAEA